MNMSFQIENSLKVLVSAALATVLTLIVITGIGSSTGTLAQNTAFSAQAAAAASGQAG
jgi:hypothetical protein